MNRYLLPRGSVFVCATVFALSLWTTDASPCGDKFLVVGRGVRYQRVYASRYPSSILVFTLSTESGNALLSLLQKAGHQVLAVASEMELDSALNSENFDLALVDLSDLMIVEGILKAAPSTPFILPYLYHTSGEVVPPPQYSCILESRNRSTDVLKTIDIILESRAKGTLPNCKKFLK